MKPKIMILDDEEESLITFEASFDDEFHILKANSTEVAFNLLKDHPDISVIVSDQRMPDMTGSEFFSKIKDLYPHVPRILLTGYSELSSAVEGINQGMIYKYLSKPYHPDETLDVLRKAIQLNKELENDKRAKNISLQQIQSKTAHAMENYTAWISHHVNNAMQTISTFIDLAQDEFRNKHEDEAAFARLAKAYVEQVTSIINTLHQIYAEGLESFSHVSLKTLFNFLDESLTERIENKKIQLKIDLPKEEIKMMANSMAIQEALRRLVANSVEASKEGDLIELSASEFEEHGRKAVMFQINDYGCGIIPEIKEKLFYPFLQLGTNAQQPRGLGLPYVQAVIARHGGTISVESKLGEGTTVTFTLPVIPE